MTCSKKQPPYFPRGFPRKMVDIGIGYPNRVSPTAWWCNVPIVKNDGLRQWEEWHPIYEMENKIHVRNHQPAIVVTSLPIYIPYDTPIMFETTNQSKLWSFMYAEHAAALCPFDVSLFPHLWWPCSVLGFERRHPNCPTKFLSTESWVPLNTSKLSHWLTISVPFTSPGILIKNNSCYSSI